MLGKHSKLHFTCTSNVSWFSPSWQQRTTRSLSHSSPASGMGRTIGRKRQKLVRWDKNSLTEQQREQKITRTLIKRIYRVQYSHRVMPSSLLSSESPCCSQLPHVNTECGIRSCQVSQVLWLSPAGLLWKLTLAQLNPGQMGHRIVGLNK